MNKAGAKTGVVETRKMSSELFALTYGALVTELLADFEDQDAVNRQLDKMGFSLGARLADDFLAKTANAPRCTDVRQIADALARHALPMYLGTSAAVSGVSSAGDEATLTLDSNPLMEFVELPAHLDKLCYSQLLAGAVRGALEALHLQVAVTATENASSGLTELRLKFVRLIKESMPAGEE